MTREQIHERISYLIGKLKATDYKVIKCYEASMLDKPLPYDIGLITEERDAWREEIKLLEEKLKT